MDSFLVRVVSYAWSFFFRPARIWIGLRRALAILALAFAFGPMLAFSASDPGSNGHLWWSGGYSGNSAVAACTAYVAVAYPGMVIDGYNSSSGFVTVIGLLIRISVAACATSVCGRTTVVSLAMFCSLMGLASRTHRFRRIVLIRRLRISTVVLVTRRHRRRLVRLITSASRVVSTTPGV